MTQPLYTIRQVAYVVRDMDAALKYWTETLKVGPFFLAEHCPLENQKYRGGESHADVSLHLATRVMCRLSLFIVKMILHRYTKSFWMRAELGFITLE